MQLIEEDKTKGKVRTFPFIIRMISMLDITLLGTGGGMPMPKRHLSSMILSYSGRKILIDCGEGTQVAMRKFHTGFRSLDIILLTHFHGDHTFGLPGLLATIGNSDRIAPITMVGPKGLMHVMKSVLNLTGRLPFEINIVENPQAEMGLNMDSEILQITNREKNEIYLSTMNLEHSSQCLGYKLDIPRNPKFKPAKAKEYKIPIEYWGKLQKGEDIEHGGQTFTSDMVLGQPREGLRFSYITDTRPNDHIGEFVKDSNLLVCEGTYGDSEDIDKAIKNTHMTFKEAAILAKKSNVDKLLLTHFSPSLDNVGQYEKEAKEIFENTIIGYDGYKESITYR